jgi:NADPH2:quinone reductase
MLATRGTLVLYGTATGDVPPFQLARLSGLTAGSAAGSLTVSWVSASDFLRGADRGRAMRAVLAEVAAGRLTPRIGERFALREAAAAHRLLASRTVTGKLLLAV